eukprot:TRINITY_DN35497_c0_g1_i1.p2 TRINITY_DN35497_c0_g1~~TRINITY_DN35497_c0_g1_i1.p2  ORF type:complete len:268 (-),score=46.12 TRINITY_DN35497_c0_g1_i1:39-773(-)
MDIDMNVDTEDPDTTLKVQEIDAYWLQRRINQTYEGKHREAEELRQMSDKCFQLLESETLNDRERERGLLALFDQENFNLVRELLINRLKIVWCTRRARAQTEEEKQRIEKSMAGSQETRLILEAIYATRGTVKERQDAMTKAMRVEAKKLMSNEQRNTKPDPALKVDQERRMIDFESLVFGAGDQFMSNQKVHYSGCSKQCDQNIIQQINKSVSYQIVLFFFSYITKVFICDQNQCITLFNNI